MLISKKVVVLGHFGVGKTSLIRRIVDDRFSKDYEVSIGVNITKKTIAVSSGIKVSLILWDLEGTDNLGHIRETYLLGTHAVIYVFDVTRISTFRNMLNDLSLIRNKLAGVPLKVVGNKVDLVGFDKVTTLLKEQNIPYDQLTSAKTGSRVDDLFEHLAETLVTDAKAT